MSAQAASDSRSYLLPVKDSKTMIYSGKNYTVLHKLPKVGIELLH